MCEKTAFRAFDLTMCGQLAIYRNCKKEKKKAKRKIEADLLKHSFFCWYVPYARFFADTLHLGKVNGLENTTYQSSMV